MSSNNPHGIRPGQKVYYQPGKVVLETTVISVGRKWATCATMRFDLKTMLTESTFRRTKVHLKREDLSEAEAVDAAWTRLKGIVNVRYQPPAGLKAAEINAFVDRIEGKHGPEI